MHLVGSATCHVLYKLDNWTKQLLRLSEHNWWDKVEHLWKNEPNTTPDATKLKSNISPGYYWSMTHDLSEQHFKSDEATKFGSIRGFSQKIKRVSGGVYIPLER